MEQEPQDLRLLVLLRLLELHLLQELLPACRRMRCQPYSSDHSR